VDSSGAGNFTKLQHAIDAVPLNNNRWVQIRILQGTYREKVVIPIEKPFIFLKGDGKRKTLIVWNDHGNIDESPTFICAASHIIAKSISF
ncbi:pectinesterase, partial [Genlisea aurea]